MLIDLLVQDSAWKETSKCLRVGTKLR